MKKLLCVACTGMATITLSAASAQEATPAENAGDITCGEIASMDSTTLPGVLYYIAGYQAGQRSGMVGGAGVAGEGAASAVATQGDAAAVTTEPAAAAGGDATEMKVVAGLPGYFEIPVEEAMAACVETPDARVSEVLEQHKGAVTPAPSN